MLEDPAAASAARHQLTTLHDAVVLARMIEQRAGVEKSVGAQEIARDETLRALVAYAEAIEALKWPVPRRLHMEIQMLELMQAGRRGTLSAQDDGHR